MIPILILFGLIAWFEAHSLSASQPGKQKVASVMGFIAVCALAAGTLYVLRDSFHIATLIQIIFGPLEHIITGELRG